MQQPQASHPRIKYLQVNIDSDLIEYIQKSLNLDCEFVFWLLDFGAIYLNQTRVVKNQAIHKNDVLRVHLEPKRYLVPSDPLMGLVYHDDNFILFNKPQGLPTHPTLDNRKENLLFILEQHFNKTLHPTQRLDIGTGGLILVSQSVAYQNYLTGLMNKGLLSKHYVTWTQGPTLEPKLYRHYMKKSKRAPKQITASPEADTLNCELEILEHSFCSTKNAQTLQTEILNKYHIRLITGRTHQIRAQLSFENNPIVGDTLYGSLLSYPITEAFALFCNRLEFADFKFEITPDYLP